MSADMIHCRKPLQKLWKEGRRPREKPRKSLEGQHEHRQANRIVAAAHRRPLIADECEPTEQSR